MNLFEIEFGSRDMNRRGRLAERFYAFPLGMRLQVARNSFLPEFENLFMFERLLGLAVMTELIAARTNSGKRVRSRRDFEF